VLAHLCHMLTSCRLAATASYTLCVPALAPLQIIALANLRHKATHSAQTLASGFRQEGCSQTWLPKEAGVQTRVSCDGAHPDACDSSSSRY
jgi:hypothetical protein